MAFKTLTMQEALYKIYVEGINPGLTIDQAQATHKQIQEQYSVQIAESEKINNSLGVRRTHKSYTGE